MIHTKGLNHDLSWIVPLYNLWTKRIFSNLWWGYSSKRSL